MRFFKTLISSAITAATLLVAPVQAAEFTDGEQFLIESLVEAGVTLAAGDCPTDENYGFYIPSEKYIGICTNVATDEAMAWETLRHEAVHVAQACIDPKMQTMVHNRAYIQANASFEDRILIAAHYDRSDWTVELEAFTLEHKSNEYIASMVNYACN